MTNSNKIFDRVREDTADLSRLMNSSSNVPLEQYIDKVNVTSLSNSLSLAPGDWQTEDLERILIIRDGLYDLRHNLRDAGDDAEHSVERMLSVLDRLYADLERALRTIRPEDLISSKERLSGLYTGRHIQSTSAQQLIAPIHQQSAEVLTQAHITNRNIEINLIKIDNSSIEFFNSMSLQIKRFSASVFAIRLSLEQNIIFQGIFSFLNDRVDGIIKHLKDFVTSIKGAYSTTLDLLRDVERLAEIGDRFTKQVGSFITSAFGTAEPIEERDIKFGTQNLSQSEVVLCGALTGRNTATLGGRNGNIWLVDTSTGRVITSGTTGRATIQAVAAVSDEYVAVGTDEGLGLFAGIGRGQEQLRSSYNEKITAVVAPPWGGRGVAVFTGSSDGYLRRWSLAGRLTRYLGPDSREIETKLGRSVQRIIKF